MCLSLHPRRSSRSCRDCLRRWMIRPHPWSKERFGQTRTRETETVIFSPTCFPFESILPYKACAFCAVTCPCKGVTPGPDGRFLAGRIWCPTAAAAAASCAACGGPPLRWGPPVCQMAPPLVVKRNITAHLHYCPPFQPWGALHGVAVTVSGVLFWVGVWDILDYAVLPRGWPWRVRARRPSRPSNPHLSRSTDSVSALPTP